MKVKNMTGQGFYIHPLKFRMGKDEVKDLPKELEKNKSILKRIEDGDMVVIKVGAKEPAAPTKEEMAKKVSGTGKKDVVVSGNGKEFQTDAKGAVVSQPPPPVKPEAEKKPEQPENPIKMDEEDTPKKEKPGKAPSKKTSKKTSKKKPTKKK